MIHRNDPAALEWLDVHQYAISGMNAFIGEMFSIKEDAELHPNGKSQLCVVCNSTGYTGAQLWSVGPMTEEQAEVWLTLGYECRRKGELT